MSVVDSAMTREVLRDICKRPVDISNLQVHVQHGVIYLQGRLDSVRGEYENLDLQQELRHIVRYLKLKPGIRDVVCEVEFTDHLVKEQQKPENKRGYYH